MAGAQGSPEADGTGLGMRAGCRIEVSYSEQEGQ